MTSVPDAVRVELERGRPECLGRYANLRLRRDKAEGSVNCSVDSRDLIPIKRPINCAQAVE